MHCYGLHRNRLSTSLIGELDNTEVDGFDHTCDIFGLESLLSRLCTVGLYYEIEMNNVLLSYFLMYLHWNYYICQVIQSINHRSRTIDL